MKPSEYFKKEVKGKIIVRNISNDQKRKYDYIGTLEVNGHIIFICNYWYKEYKKIPQYIPEIFVMEKL